MSETRWARPKDEEVYHSVAFRPGPNVHEETAACGMVARFYPRIGVRMADEYCGECLLASDERTKR